MKVLLLGGTGAMGKYLAPILTANGMKVTITSRASHSCDDGVKYIQGNAREASFLDALLKAHYDAIVDFMVYRTEEFSCRKDALLAATGQYIFLSSSRVYAASQTPIVEDSPRLLDVCDDEEYLPTVEYALAKPWQENCLYASTSQNWTVVRPYITYGTERLQLGVFEKEHWLYRALHGRTIVLQKDIAPRITTLTFGQDVAYVIARLIGNKKALGNTVHIAAPHTVTWDDVLQGYLAVLEQELGKQPKVRYIEDAGIERILNRYQAKYDRLYDRAFDSSKVDEICGEAIQYTCPKEGLGNCLREFLRSDRQFRTVYWRYQAYVDKLTGEYTKLKEISPVKEKRRYILRRYTPFFWSVR